MANRIYRIFWVFFLAVSGVFLLSLQNERSTDSYHVFLDLTKSNGAVHFESSEAEEDTLSFSSPPWLSAASCRQKYGRTEGKSLCLTAAKPLSLILKPGFSFP